MPHDPILYQIEHKPFGEWVPDAIWETYPHLFSKFLAYYATLRPGVEFRARRVTEGKPKYQFVGNTHVDME